MNRFYVRERSSALRLAERIIGSVRPGHPADAILRQELKSQRYLSPEETGQVTRAVFAFYRWRGWLDTHRVIDTQLERGLELAETFARSPDSFDEADLLARVVPNWVNEELEITTPLARAWQSEPKLWLRARRGQGALLAKRLGDCVVFGSGLLGDVLEYRGSIDLFRTPEFHHGEFEFQDISSQAVGFLCAPKPGELWWDACAGEGGKLLHLSDLMENRGLLWASDRAMWRLQKLKRRAARASVFNYRAASWNGSAKLPTKTKFDGVLLDAPCSGSGTWHRNPDGRWTTTLKDVKELSELQLRLITHAGLAVKPGGMLVYAVCSLMHSETELVVEAFEKEFREFEPLELRNPLEPDTSPCFQLKLLPQIFGGNGMFVAAWRRNA